MQLQYERIERFSTPSILSIHFGENAVRDNAIKLWVSDSIVKALGNQRIIPSPATSMTIDGGLLYTFPSGAHPSSVEFALQPAHPGLSHFTIRLVPGNDPQHPMDSITTGIFVMP